MVLKIFLHFPLRIPMFFLPDVIRKYINQFILFSPFLRKNNHCKEKDWKSIERSYLLTVR